MAKDSKIKKEKRSKVIPSQLEKKGINSSSKGKTKAIHGEESFRSVKAELVHDDEFTGPTDINESIAEKYSKAETEALTPSLDFDESEILKHVEDPLVPEELKDVVLLSPSEEKTKAVATADPMTLYMASIQKYPLLSREAEHKLAVHFYESKDPDAAQALVTSNLRFVVKIAAEYSRFGAKLIDLVQEGNMGLLHAVREFNPYKGVRLITYAVWWIRGYIQEYLMRQYSLVRIGTTQNQRKLFYKLKKEKEQIDSLGDISDYDLLSERLGIPKQEIIDMENRLNGRDVSLDRPLDDETKSTLGDFQSNKDQPPLDEELALKEHLTLLKEMVDEIRPSLSDRELILLDERILADEPLTLQEIGEKYSITREAVRQMEVRIINKIKKKFLSSIEDESKD